MKGELEGKGHEALIYPDKIEVGGKAVTPEEYHRMRRESLEGEALRVKRELMAEHVGKIERSDAVLAYNPDRKGIKGYVGGNTFYELAVAHYLGKELYLWKMPDESLPYYEEIVTMGPTVLEEDLQRL